MSDKNTKLRIMSLFAVDDVRDVGLIKRRIAELKQLGFDGLVFHPRRYSGDPPYMSDDYIRAVDEAVLYAKELGVSFWLYDENGWPSGSANGLVEKLMPELKSEWLEYRDGEIIKRSRPGINSLDKNGVRKFIELTHRTYKDKLSAEAFDYVEGFFSDEVGFLWGHGASYEFHGVPWLEALRERFRQEKGEDIDEYLKELFIGDETSEFRIWYWENLTRELSESFYLQIEKWCMENGKKFTAHLKGEENPFFQIGYSGSCLQVLKNVSVPGIDALERYPGNKYYPCIPSSLARQFGDGTAMAEAIGGAGWGLSPQDLENYASWLIESGINTLIFHISQLHLDHGGITDWPASIPTHLSWKRAFPAIIERLKKKYKAESNKRRDLLVVSPDRGVESLFTPSQTEGMNEHDGSGQGGYKSCAVSRGVVELCDRLYERGIRFDLTDEKIFEEDAEIRGDKLYLGKSSYSALICPPGCMFSETGREKLERAQRAGIVKDASAYAKDAMRETKKPDESGGEEYFIDQTEWEIKPPRENRILLNTKKDGIYIFSEFEIGGDFDGDITVLVTDENRGVYLNGAELRSVRSDEYGFYYAAEEYINGLNELKIDIGEGEDAFIFLLGSFGVFSKAGYSEFGDGRQIECEGKFIIDNIHKLGVDLIRSGLPYCIEPVEAFKTLRVKDDIKDAVLEFDLSRTDAMEIKLEDGRGAWLYGDNNSIEIGDAFAGEEYRIACAFFPSTFNCYGPHRYYKGDRHIISPCQYSGIKNFADESDAPEFTLDDKLKFVKWELPRKVKIKTI